MTFKGAAEDLSQPWAARKLKFTSMSSSQKLKFTTHTFCGTQAEEVYKNAMRLEESLLEEANQARTHDQLLRERREKTLAQIRNGLVEIITIE